MGNDDVFGYIASRLAFAAPQESITFIKSLDFPKETPFSLRCASGLQASQIHPGRKEILNNALRFGMCQWIFEETLLHAL
jgi:hypothetical protein